MFYTKGVFIKWLISLVFLMSCKSEQKKDCPLIVDAVIKSVAVKFAESQECNLEKTVNLFYQAEGKVLSCDPKIQYAGINGSSVVCGVVPQLVAALVDADLLGLECKKAPESIESVLKKLLKCQ